MSDDDRRLIERATDQVLLTTLGSAARLPFGSAAGAAEFILDTADASLRGEDVVAPTPMDIAICAVFFRANNKASWARVGEARALKTLEAFGRREAKPGTEEK